MTRHYPTLPVNTQEQSENFFSIFAQRSKEIDWGVTLAPLDNSRSGKQNRLSHMLYSAISNQSKEYSSIQAKNHCKYHLGVPILIKDEGWATSYFKMLLANLVIEDRVKAMEHIALTSIMTVKQKARYLDNVYKYWEGDRGLVLPRPDDLYYESLGVKR